jgi:glycosyltransferase involved in cell wall biosynthesis
VVRCLAPSEMRVWFASTNDSGGAGRAATRTYRYLRGKLAHSIFSVLNRKTDAPTHSCKSDPIARVYRKLRLHLEGSIEGQINIDKQDLFSINLMSSGVVREINSADIDVVNLFWICGYLSIKDLGKIYHPVVWRFSDLWPITYGYHYDKFLVDSSDWKYYRSKLGRGARTLLDWKIANLPRNLTIICPSRWMYQIVMSSELFPSDRVLHIPTGIDTQMFRPMCKESAKKALGFSSSSKVVLVGANSGDSDQRKGFGFVRDVLVSLKRMNPSVQIIGFGKAANDDPLIVWLGSIESDNLLRTIMSASDVYLNGSKIDNFPQTVLEALSCGCPVVAYSNTGVAEALGAGDCGMLIEIDESAETVAEKITALFSDESRLVKLSNAARNRVVSKYPSELYADRLLRVYSSCIGSKN